MAAGKPKQKEYPPIPILKEDPTDIFEFIAQLGEGEAARGVSRARGAARVRARPRGSLPARLGASRDEIGRVRVCAPLLCCAAVRGRRG
jgi:hypothetical protein